MKIYAKLKPLGFAKFDRNDNDGIAENTTVRG
jgi:hypothetical protein